MKIFKRFLMGIGTVVLLALSLQLVAPKAVHAVVSTLVTVANTPTNPVPTREVDNPADYPFSAPLCFGSSDFCGGAQAVVYVPTVTTTGLPIKRLVIETVTGTCYDSLGEFGELAGLGIVVYPPSPDNVGSSQGDIAQLPASQVKAGYETFSGPIRMYASPGASIAQVQFGYTGTGGGTGGCYQFIIGHLVLQ
jgi:hypothetical protein